MNIIVDTKGDADLRTREHLIESDDDLEFEDTGSKPSKFFSIEEDLIQEDVTPKKVHRVGNKDIDLEEFENEMGWTDQNPQKYCHRKKVNIISLMRDKTVVEQVLKNSVIKPGFEQLNAIPTSVMGKRKLKAKKRKERERTAGNSWFNMRPPQMTPEIKHDLQVLQMRSALDPKHFYKKNDLKVIPKYFHIGKVIDSPVNYYSDRLTKKERKSTIVDELMHDAEFSKYNKRKYKEIIDEKKKLHYKAHKHAKRLKGKKK
ncbi:deoxynucleotidyltransferase terminal-interacting protein 2 [Nomia melanderi]|uniref:deoxynucleotidyltransferase terminal-interacting protein 2 n=1 Tax=Nomia melanderi TaxID=2448451 RepID=UPI001304573D|nr:deoxynucleotidyltransferase terminal-interacting protein 2 [Nomia melanderi]